MAIYQLTPEDDGWTTAPWLLLRGFGFGWAAIPVQTMALQVITGPALAKASSLFNVTRQIFSSIGIALLTTYLVQQTNQHVTEARAQLPAGATLDPTSPQGKVLIAQAGTAGINDVFVAVTIGGIVLLVIALALPSRNQRAATLAKASDSSNPNPTLSQEQHEPMVLVE